MAGQSPAGRDAAIAPTFAKEELLPGHSGSSTGAGAAVVSGHLLMLAAALRMKPGVGAKYARASWSTQAPPASPPPYFPAFL